jgi:hypothetical protein
MSNEDKKFRYVPLYVGGLLIALAVCLTIAINATSDEVYDHTRIYPQPSDSAVAKALSDTLQIEEAPTFVIPKKYRIAYSKVDKKYAVFFLYPDHQQLLGWTELSNDSIAGFAEKHSRWQMNDSADAIQLIKQHRKQVTADRDRAIMDSPADATGKNSYN